MTHLNIQESLLHYVWETRQFDFGNLQTENGKDVKILSWGYKNIDAGPDFSEVKLLIDKTVWVGNVEMHIKAKDWDKHNHNNDKLYDNVILHVVYEFLGHSVFTNDGVEIPCISLKNRIPESILYNYFDLMESNNAILCAASISSIDQLTIASWKERLIAERLEHKTEKIKIILERYNYDWNSTFYVLLCRYMGSRTNADNFELLAHKIPLSIILKNRDNVSTIESILYGQAEMLELECADPYFLKLKKEYQYLAHKYEMQTYQKIPWKYAKMRPFSFPTIRISQLAHILHSQVNTFSKVLEDDDWTKLKEHFLVEASSYWNDHFRFGSSSNRSIVKRLTLPFIDLLLINVIAPLLFLYGIEKKENSFISKSISLLESIKAEKNSIVKSWQNLGLEVHNSLDSQALIHLKNNYCNQKKCLSCSIGNKIVGI